MTEVPTSRSDVLQDIREARAELEATFAGVSREQMTALVTGGGWSIKDHLAHIAEWQRRGLAVIDGRPQWEGLGIDEETFRRLNGIDEVNEILFRRNKDRALDDVLADFQRTQERVEATIASMTDDELQREIEQEMPARYRRIVDIASYNFAGHDRDHIADLRKLAAKNL